MVIDDKVCRIPYGGVYKVDTTKVHTAINASKILRTHLVFCLPKPAVDKSKPLPWEMPTELGGPYKGADAYKIWYMGKQRNNSKGNRLLMTDLIVGSDHRGYKLKTEIEKHLVPIDKDIEKDITTFLDC